MSYPVYATSAGASPPNSYNVYANPGSVQGFAGAHNAQGYAPLPQEDPEHARYVRVVHTSEQGLAAHVHRHPEPYTPGLHQNQEVHLGSGAAYGHRQGSSRYSAQEIVGTISHSNRPSASELLSDVNKPATPRPAMVQRRGCCQRWFDGDFVIVPEGKMIFLDMWDCVVILALFATAFLLPFEVALLAVPPAWWLQINSAINWIFVVDILVTFNVAFEIRSGSTVELYERRPLMIAANYMAWPFSDGMRAGWFWPDLITVLPWERIIQIAAAYLATVDSQITDLLFKQAEQAAETESKNSMFQFIRVLKLFRMFRLVRVAKLFKRWHTQVGFSYASVEVLKCLAVTILTCHWLACAWGYFGIKDDAEHSWLIQIATNPGSHLAEEEDLANANSLMIYNLALYWATMTLTTVGYGDVIPQSEEEVFIVTVAMISTSFIWAYVLGSVVSIIQNVDVYHTHFSQLMDDLNLLLSKGGVPDSLRRQCRRHLHEAYNIQRAAHQQSTMKYLSPGLQGQLALHGGQDKVCQCLWYLANIKEDVLVDIAQVINGDLYSPNEFIFDRRKAMVIRRGTVAFKGRILHKDATLGIDMIMSTDRLRETAGARTLNFVEVMSLHRNDLWEVAERHPDFKTRLRKAQIKLALFRAFVEEGRRRRKKAELEARGKTLRDDGHKEQCAKKEPSLMQIMHAVKSVGNDISDFRKEANASMSSLSSRISALEVRMSRLEQVSSKHK